MTPSADRQTRSRASRQAASVVALVLALMTAGLIAPAARLLGVVGALIIAVVVARWMTRTGAGESAPTVPAPNDPAGDEVGRLLERGMGDLNRYLERHAAFAAYLASREQGGTMTAPAHPSPGSSPPGRCSPVRGSGPL